MKKLFAIVGVVSVLSFGFLFFQSAESKTADSGKNGFFEVKKTADPGGNGG